MSSFWCGKSCRIFIETGFTFVRLSCLYIFITFLVQWLGRTTHGVVRHWWCTCVGREIVGQCAINLLWWCITCIFWTSLSYILDRSPKSQFPMLRDCDNDWYTHTTGALWSVDRIFRRSWSCIWNRALLDKKSSSVMQTSSPQNFCMNTLVSFKYNTFLLSGA